MQDPWKIIGNIVLLILAVIMGRLLVILALGAIRSLLLKYAHHRLHRATRDIPPEAGQVWMQDGKRLEVDRIFENGVIGIKMGNVSWGETPEKWHMRVYNRKLRLIKKSQP